MNTDLLKAQLAVAGAKLALYAWDESQHPRVPAGSSDGGQFGSGGATEPVIIMPASKAAPGFKIPPPKGMTPDITHRSGLLARKLSSGKWAILKPVGPGEPAQRLGMAENETQAKAMLDKFGK